MIAVDTSALMAILQEEPEADACMAALLAATEIVISAGTVVEALIVSASRGIKDDMVKLISGLGIEIAAVTPAAATRAGDAHARWGRGVHPAALNFGDCFAYEVATSRGCPLLYVGNDFAQTDVKGAL